MEVKRKNSKEIQNEVSFDKIEIGQFFEYKKQPYIKINSSDAYCFTDNDIYCGYYGNECELVTPISTNKCKFIYKI